MKNQKLGLVLTEYELNVLKRAFKEYQERYGYSLMDRRLGIKLDILSDLKDEGNIKYKKELIRDNENRITKYDLVCKGKNMEKVWIVHMFRSGGIEMSGQQQNHIACIFTQWWNSRNRGNRRRTNRNLQNVHRRKKKTYFQVMFA